MRFLVAVILSFALAMPASADTFRRLRTTSNTTTGQACLQLIAGARGVTVKRIHMTLATAVASVVTVQKTSALGTPSATAAFTSITAFGSTAATSLSTTVLAWSVQPTAVTYAYDRITFPATIGTERERVYDVGLYVAPGDSIIIINQGTTGVFDIAIEIEE